MEYKFYTFTENTSWDEEARFLNYQAEQGWLVVAVVVPGPNGVLLLGRGTSDTAETENNEPS